MRECIYCGESKVEDTFTLEHVIPQSLGGAQGCFILNYSFCELMRTPGFRLPKHMITVAESLKNSLPKSRMK